VECQPSSQEANAFIKGECVPSSRATAPAAAGGGGEGLRYAPRMDPNRLGVLPPGALAIAAATNASSSAPLHLGSAVLCSYYPTQVKFSELTLDTFRMMRACEWDDAASSSYASAGNGTGGGVEGGLSGAAAAGKGGLSASSPSWQMSPHPKTSVGLYKLNAVDP
jgi:hypothetical protein